MKKIITLFLFLFLQKSSIPKSEKDIKLEDLFQKITIRRAIPIIGIALLILFHKKIINFFTNKEKENKEKKNKEKKNKEKAAEKLAEKLEEKLEEKEKKKNIYTNKKIIKPMYTGDNELTDVENKSLIKGTINGNEFELLIYEHKCEILEQEKSGFMLEEDYYLDDQYDKNLSEKDIREFTHFNENASLYFSHHDLFNDSERVDGIRYYNLESDIRILINSLFGIISNFLSYYHKETFYYNKNIEYEVIEKFNDAIKERKPYTIIELTKAEKFEDFILKNFLPDHSASALPENISFKKYTEDIIEKKKDNSGRRMIDIFFSGKNFLKKMALFQSIKDPSLKEENA